MISLDVTEQSAGDILEKLGLFSMENTRKGIEKIMKNQTEIIKFYLSSNDDEKRVYTVEDIQKILNISRETLIN